MSPVPAGSSPAPEPRTIVAWLTSALDRIQAAGNEPTVNPARTPWTPPGTRPHPVISFLAAFVALTALFLYWFFVADGSGGFIYTGF
jgi:hypothetical protein